MFNDHQDGLHTGITSAKAKRYTERLVEADIEPLVGSIGDSYDDVVAETINGLYTRLR